MRFPIGVLSFSLVFAASAAPSPEGKPVRAKTGQPVAPAQGIKTPGVQIPFASLKVEASLPAANKPTWLFFSPAPTGGLLFPESDRLDKVDPKTNKVADPIAGLKGPCGGAISAFGSIWIATCGDGSLSRLDPKTLKVTATIPAGASDVRGSLAATADSIWMLTDSKATLARIDPDQNAVVGEMRVPPGCGSLSFGETALWLTCPAENRVLRINPATNQVEKAIDVSGLPESLVTGEASIWVLCAKEGKIDRIDPKTNKVTKSIELKVSGAAGQLAFGEGALWVTMTGFPLTRVDVQSESVVQQFFGEGGGAILTSAGAIWLSNLNDGTVSRIDPKRVLATLAE